ncbi:myb-like protein D [Mercenaria mercenaria]|uniref:myb-like protein D n=1 Tax=Mercenaria mercenaria TaxID=6596 RepID=UPI00234F7720|nr:myb-like protein D [Mercenaria mercenaria]XP_045191310.2 myb-like protein D [Mercenaria mercenaria]XP_053380740.1 myb-like protein D [Mercenaria mercenaria]
METGKCADSEDKDKQGHFMNSKDLVSDIKSKVDFDEIIDVSLEGQDYTNGLNAEVDLDESVDKKDSQTDKGDGLDESGNNEKNDQELMNGHKGDTEKLNEEINLEIGKDGSDIVENTNTSEGEFLEGNSTSGPEDKSDMGNNLESKGLETDVDGNIEQNVKELDQSEEGELENNNVKETLDNENLNPTQKEGCPDENVNDNAHESTKGTKQVENASKENLDTGMDAVDTTIEAESETKENNLDNESPDSEETRDKGNESQGLDFKLDPKSEKCSTDTEANCTADLENESLEGNKEVEHNVDEGIIDREKIQNFIKEVINDLQGIVIEADECDSVVNEMCDEDTRSELVSDKTVADDVHEVAVTTEAPESSVESEPKEVIGNQEETSIEASDEISGSKMNEIELSGKNTPCELVIKEDTDTTQTSETHVSQTENAPKTNDTTTEDHKTSEASVDNAGDLPKTHEMPSEHHDEKCNVHDGQEKQNTTETQTEQPVRRKEKNDITMVEEELKTTQTALRKSQQCLQDERSKHNREVISLKLQLCRSQTELKQQKSKSEKQLTEIMSHLVMLESRLRREQLKLQRDTRDKNHVIENQKKEIVKLKDQNEQLMNAIKEICANGGMNGYMRRKNGNYGDSFENSAKGNRDKKGHAGKLGSMKDKFSSKNRSSLELSSLNLEKYLIKNERLCSSQEDLHRIGDERRRSIPSGDERMGRNQSHDTSPKDRPVSDNSEYKNGNRKKHVRYAQQNFFSDYGSPKYEMNKSVSDSSHLSESSGFHSLSDHDLSAQTDSLTNGNHGNHDYTEDDEDDDRIFSFSSTHINTVIDEEEAMGPVMSHSGPMMSMGSMPMLANLKEDQLGSGKNRPHSLSGVDLMSIQQQAQNLSKFEHKISPKGSPVSEMSTPPSSPSYMHAKNELTPFQTFKTMFRRKGSSKNKGHKKRSVSLSQTTNMEYSEALKKHFQKYDMS